MQNICQILDKGLSNSWFDNPLSMGMFVSQPQSYVLCNQQKHLKEDTDFKFSIVV